MNKLKPEENVLPVERQKIKGKFKHVILVIPALDERWITVRGFGYYTFPPTKPKNVIYSFDSKKEWLHKMAFILDDIWWLCELPYHKFWSQVIFHKESMNGIQSFLHLAPLQMLYLRIGDNEILNMYKRIKKAVYQFLKRICRTQESSLHFMSEEKYQEIITSHNLLPMSLVLCICSVYSKEEQTEKIIFDLFKYNTSLRLDDVVLKTTQFFGYIYTKMKDNYKYMKKSIEESEYKDLNEILNTYRKSIVTAVQFLTPAAMSISNFILVYKDGCNILSMLNFEYHIIRTYKKLLVSLYQEVNLLFDGVTFEKIRSRLIIMLKICRVEFLKIFNACLNSSLDKLSNNRESFDIIHNYVKIMKYAMKVKEFVYDFNYTYSIEEITKAFNNCNSNIDLSEVNRIKEIMTESFEKLRNNTETKSNDETSLNKTDSIYEKDLSKLNLEDPKEVATLIENYCIDLTSETEENSDNESIDSDFSKSSSDYDDSSEYDDWSKNDDNDTEYGSYLSSVGDLEIAKGSGARNESKNSSDDLSDDRRLESEFINDQPGPSGINIKTSQVQSELEIAIDQVRDVLPYLGDGFIVMCLEHYKRDPSAVINAILENNLASSLKSIDQNLPYIPLELLKNSTYDVEHLSKSEDLPLKELRKVDYTNFMEMLNDKSEISNCKNVYERYQIVSHDVYDDDVEEDYEDDAIPAMEADPESLYINKNWLTEPFNKSIEYEECEPEQSEPSSSESKDIRKPLDFCENPETVRERNEQKRKAKEERRYPKNRDKQSSSVNLADDATRERHFKTIYKSRNANHNRRNLSDRKRIF